MARFCTNLGALKFRWKSHPRMILWVDKAWSIVERKINLGGMVGKRRERDVTNIDQREERLNKIKALDCQAPSTNRRLLSPSLRWRQGSPRGKLSISSKVYKSSNLNKLNIVMAKACTWSFLCKIFPLNGWKSWKKCCRVHWVKRNENFQSAEEFFVTVGDWNKN